MAKCRPILFSALMVEAILAGRKSMTRRVLKAGFDADGMVFERITDYTSCEVGGVLDPLSLGTQACFNDSNHNNPKKHLLGVKCPYGNVGDELWVRESYYAYGMWLNNENPETGKKWWTFMDTTLTGMRYGYCEEVPKFVIKERKHGVYGWYKRPSLFMPRVASRICLEIVGIRVERLHDISEGDAEREGVETKPYGSPPYFCTIDYVGAEMYKKSRHVENRNFKPGFCAPTGRQYRSSFTTLWKVINGKDAWGLNPWVWVVEFKRKEVVDGVY